MPNEYSWIPSLNTISTTHVRVTSPTGGSLFDEQVEEESVASPFIAGEYVVFRDALDSYEDYVEDGYLRIGGRYKVIEPDEYDDIGLVRIQSDREEELVLDSDCFMPKIRRNLPEWF